MDEIEEIQINAEENKEPDAEEKTEEIEETEETPAPKKRGRPPGSLNKTTKKPEAKKEPKKAEPKKAEPKKVEPKKKKPPKRPVVEESSSEEEEYEEPRRSVRHHVPNAEIDRRALAAEMLTMLQDQHYNKSQMRRNHYASWFKNGM